MSLSGAAVTSTGIYSITENQGGLAFDSECALAINYSNRYLLSELSNRSLDFILPFSKSVTGISFSYFGNKELNQSRYSIVYGCKLTKWLGAGIMMNFNQLSVGSIGERTSAVSGNIGIQAYPMKNLCLGAEVFNPTKSRFFSVEENDLYSGVKLGISFTDKESFKLSSQYNLNNFIEDEWCLAGEYGFCKLIILRGGLKIKRNPSWSFGTAIRYKRFLIDIGFEHHTVLGLSAATTLIYQLKDHED